MRAIQAITPNKTYTPANTPNFSKAIPAENKKSIEENTTDPSKPNYNDPLAKWPVRGMAYSNELGVAISEIAPKLGALLWVPALMYFGADIYDKYKNKDTNYDPSGRRGLEQATFQALASVILPTVAVHLGQKAFSGIDKFKAEKLSTNAKEETLNFINDFLNKTKITNYENNLGEYKQKFETSLKTYVADTKAEHNSKNIFKRILSWAFSAKHPEALGKADQKRLMEYAKAQLNDVLEVRDSLMKGERPKNLTDKLYNKFKSIQESYKKDFGEAHYLHKSAKFLMREKLSSKIFNMKMFKTLGGFAALGALITPIDIFVEHTIMKKVVEPNFDKLNNKRISLKGGIKNN